MIKMIVCLTGKLLAENLSLTGSLLVLKHSYHAT